jgi:hypothetical protein
MSVALAWTRPTRARAALVWFKRRLLSAWRLASDMCTGRPPRWPRSDALRAAPECARVSSALWTDGRPEEFVLVAGKVHNLRLAVRAFDGVEVPAGAVLSFWRQLGAPSARRGFVEGREVMAGCVVPTPGGGLCQLSNALAEAARQAGIGLVEHHRHSARIEAAPFATDSLDATVAWRHVDLRLQASFAFRVEAWLDADQLHLRLRAQRASGSPSGSRSFAIAVPSSPVARGCLSCEERACFRHRAQTLPAHARRAVLAEAHQPELLAALGDDAFSADWFLPWWQPSRRAADWPLPAGTAVRRPLWASCLRSAALRRAARVDEGGARQSALMRGAERLARAHGARLSPLHLDLVVVQELLVPLWRSGALAGRRFDVFVSQLPADELQARLDGAAAMVPDARSLGDFRVGADWMAAEWEALTAARRCLTAHAEVAHVLQARGLAVQRLPWRLPAVAAVPRAAETSTPLIVFPASALARKGVHAVATAARHLGCRVRVLGRLTTNDPLWADVRVEAGGYAGPWLADASAVVLPAFIEHQPRPLLRALAAGVPVLASAACGLGSLSGWREVPAGDADALTEALSGTLRQSRG